MAIYFTDRELDVMNVLWERGSATVAETREEIPDELAYTTVLTVLQTLEEKGYVQHEREGRAYRYFPTVTRRDAAKSALRRMLGKMFRGDPELLLAHLVADRGLTEDEVDRLRDLLDSRLGRDGERGRRRRGGGPRGAPGDGHGGGGRTGGGRRGGGPDER